MTHAVRMTADLGTGQRDTGCCAVETGQGKKKMRDCTNKGMPGFVFYEIAYTVLGGVIYLSRIDNRCYF